MNEIEIYGVCTNYKFIEDVIFATIQDENGTLYKVFIDEKDVDAEIEEGKHYCVIGEEGNVIDWDKAHIIHARYFDNWGRYCSHCGKHHEEGYWIGEYEYACSDECAIALMGGKEAFDEAKNEYDDDANYNPICWVEWYN